MFKNLLRPDSPLMITMSNITDCIFLSLFFLVGCFPVVTIGASFAALYDATFRGLRQGEKNTWQRFAHVFKTNWKAGLGPTVVFLGFVLGLVCCLIALWNSAVAGKVSWMVFSGAAFLAAVILGILSILFPMLSRFENSCVGLLKNSLLLGLANLPRTAALGSINAVTVFLCVRFVFPLFFLPSVAALLGSWLIEPMFRPYLEEAA